MELLVLFSRCLAYSLDENLDSSLMKVTANFSLLSFAGLVRDFPLGCKPLLCSSMCYVSVSPSKLHSVAGYREGLRCAVGAPAGRRVKHGPQNGGKLLVTVKNALIHGPETAFHNFGTLLRKGFE